MIFQEWRHKPPEIETERLLLRCPMEEDGPELFAAISQSLPELRPWFAWTENLTLTPDSFTMTAAYGRERFLCGEEMQFYIFAREGSQLMGICGLVKPDWVKLSFEICYWLRTRFVGLGYMSEAVTAVTQFAIVNLDARRIEARCDPANESGIAVALRAGYVHEQTVTNRARHHVHGEPSKVAILVHPA